MSDMNYTPLNPDEALHAFMDGELDSAAEEQHLFDELAASPDLRGEMKDALSIRAAVHRDLLAPPASSEGALLSSLGLASGTAVTASGASAATGASAVTAGMGMRTLLSTAVLCLVTGFVVAWLLLPRETINQSNGIAGYTSQQQGAQQQGTQQQQPTASAPVRIDTVVAIRYVNRPVVVRQEVAPIPTPADQNAQTPQSPASTEVAANETVSTIEPTATRNDAFLHPRSTSDAMLWSARKPGYESPAVYSPQVIARVRTLANGLEASEPTPESVQQAFLPNTAIALMYPLNDNHRLGFEMGTESFRQEYTGVEDGRDVIINQTPVLMWMGATYQYQMTDVFSFLPGLYPFAEMTLGMAFEQGPLGRGQIGLAYQPIGPLRISVGFDGSALIYSHQGNSFTSSKWGFTYGLSFDLGTLR